MARGNKPSRKIQIVNGVLERRASFVDRVIARECQRMGFSLICHGFRYPIPFTGTAVAISHGSADLRMPDRMCSLLNVASDEVGIFKINTWVEMVEATSEGAKGGRTQSTLYWGMTVVCRCLNQTLVFISVAKPKSQMDIHQVRGVKDKLRRLTEMLARSLVVNTEDPGLTKRELEVLRLIAEGKRSSEISRCLCISEHTVNQHVRSVQAKFGTTSRIFAAAQAAGRGLI